MKEEVNMQKDYSYIKVIIIAVLLALFVRSFLFNVVRVQQTSMYPTVTVSYTHLTLPTKRIV